ncbi:MAG: lipoprotein insertase outer membrane protein LolB [Methylophilaceae bacterium]
MLNTCRRRGRDLSIILGLFLAGCAALPSTALRQPENLPEIHRQHMQDLAKIRQFNLNGRIGVQANGKGFSGTAQWQHERGANQIPKDDIALFSPLGSQFATIKTAPEGVTLVTADRKTYTARDAESLTYEVLGWRLPVTGLADWILGHPTSGLAELTHWDALGRITRLKQNGWEIEYPQYIEIDGFQLPNKINLRNHELSLKLVIKEWSVSVQAASSNQADSDNINQNHNGQDNKR